MNQTQWRLRVNSLQFLSQPVSCCSRQTFGHAVNLKTRSWLELGIGISTIAKQQVLNPGVAIRQKIERLDQLGNRARRSAAGQFQVADGMCNVDRVGVHSESFGDGVG